MNITGNLTLTKMEDGTVQGGFYGAFYYVNSENWASPKRGAGAGANNYYFDASRTWTGHHIKVSFFIFISSLNII